MARPLIHSARVLRTGAPLALEAIRQVAPSVFASGPAEDRSARYAYLPTIQPLQTLLDNGWGVYEASQQRARGGNDGFAKHMLRMRKLDHFTVKHQDQFTEGVPEVVLINAHDGTSAYHLFAGWFRFICSNGLIVGNKMEAFKVRHTVGPQTSLEVLEAGERTVTERFPQLIANVDRMRAFECSRDHEVHLAETAVKLRYGDTVAPFPAADLLAVRRDEDARRNMRAVLNRIQENIIDGGWETRSTMFARRSAVKPVERVSAVVKINTGLWDAAEEIMA